MATAAAMSASWVNDRWIVTSFRCSAIAPLSRTFGLPHISVMTSMSRWMPSGSIGRLENREPDHALMTASLAAHRAARCRAADELLSAASRRSPGVNVSANTVPGWSTCAAKSGMKTRSIPSPTIAMAETLPRVNVAVAEARCRVEQHLGFLPLLGIGVVEPAIGGPLVHRAPARDRRRQPALTGHHPLIRPRLVVVALLGIKRREQCLRVHERNQSGNVAEPEAGNQPRPERE